MPKRRAVKPPPTDRDNRQMTLAGTPVPNDAAAMAKRAVERRGVVDGRVRLAVNITRAAAEALSARATRQTRNLEEIVTEIIEREAGG